MKKNILRENDIFEQLTKKNFFTVPYVIISESFLFIFISPNLILI